MRILAAIALGGGATATAIACSGGSGSAPAAPIQTAGATTSHAIHVFVKQPNGSSRRVDFGPGTDVSLTANGSGEGASQAQKRPLGRHPRILPMTADAGSAVVPAPTIADPGTDIEATAWELVARAADSCFNGEFSGLPPWGSGNSHVTGYGNWFVYGLGPSFPGVAEGRPLPGDCAGRVYVEQNLVCIADALAQVADAVGDVVWPALPSFNTGTVCPTATPEYDYGEGDATVLGAGGLGAQTCEFGAEWDIPPQADADRFIVRDLAIHTLGMIPVIDSYNDIIGQSCATTFTQVMNGTLAVDPVANAGNIVEVFGVHLSATDTTVPFFPPSNVPYVGNMPAIAGTALDVEAQILRSSGRLLHDLIRRDVYSDLAAAAQQSAQALDPVGGNETAWGQVPSTGTLYGTIAHASRVLLGRWEIGDKVGANTGGIPATVADPECEGLPELDLLPGGSFGPSAFGTDYSARYMDRPIATPGEQTAVQLVERSGMVLPTSAIPTGDATALRAALIAQLQLEEQIQNHLPQPLPATALQEVLSPSNVADADLIFAFQRALRTWRLLTNTADTTADGGAASCAAGVSALEVDAGAGAAPGLPAGLVMATYPANWPTNAGQPLLANNTLCAVVVQGGLSRSRLSTDPIARAGGMMEASQCQENTTMWDEWGYPMPALTTSLSTTVSYAALPPSGFQDAFHIGQALERRLNLLRIAGSKTTNPDPVNVAKGGIAELRSWAGNMIVHAWPQGSFGIWNSFVVRVGGMSYAHDFGLGNVASGAGLPSVQKAFGFVYGPPWMAECAAHVRADCPSGFTVQTGTAQDVTSKAEIDPDSDSDSDGEFDTLPYAASGVLDNVFEITVSMNAFNPIPPVFNPAVAATPSESHLYMILLRDPASTTGQGRVLGTLPLRGNWTVSGSNYNPNTGVVGFVDAPMQRELVHDAIDLGAWVGARPPALGDPSAAQSSGYCVDGVPRNLFVPLDNELISGTQTYEDSWQAYLSLAQTAAQTADTLGQALITNDLTISQNQQAAEEALANLCGDFGALSSATVQTNGTISPDPADQNMQACLGVGPDGGSQTVDVVFLGQMPPGVGPTDTAKIQAAIGCDAGADGGSAPVVSSLCGKSSLTADFLGITAPDAGASDGGLLTASCNDLLANVIPTIRNASSGGFDAQGYLNDLKDPSQSPNGMQSVANQLEMTVDIYDDWQVYYGQNTKIMASDDIAYWPMCLDNANCSVTDPKGTNPVNPTTAAMATAWSYAFRSCPKGDFTVPLGQCEGDAQGDGVGELNMIKWRVTQAMWMLAASAGQLPGGMFLQPVPAIFGGNTYQTSTSSDILFCQDPPNAPNGPNGPDFFNCSIDNINAYYYPTGLATYYSGGGLTTPATTCAQSAGVYPCCRNEGNSCQSIINGSTGDIATVGPVFPINAAFGMFGSSSDIAGNGNGEVPYWYSLLYAPSSPAVHFLTVNAPANFDQCAKGYQGAAYPFPTQATCGSSSSGSGSTSVSQTPTSFAELVGAATSLSGIACGANFGEPPSHGAVTILGGNPWSALVGQVKLGLSAVNSTGTAWGTGQSWLLPTSTTDFVQWDESYSPLTAPTDVIEGDLSGNSSPGTVGPLNTWLPGRGWAGPGDLPYGNAYVLGALAPTQWAPSARALSFSGYGAAPNGTCGAATLLLQASALACTPPPAVAASATVALSGPPSVTTLADIPVLEAWLAKTSTLIDGATSRFFLQEIPQQVVQDIKQGTVGSGAIGGSRGQAVLTMEQQINQLSSAWTAMASDLSSISQNIGIANGAITAAVLTMKTTDGQLALQTITTQANMAMSVDNFLMTLASSAGQAWQSFGTSSSVIPAAILTLADSLSYGNQELGQLQSESNTASQVEQNQLYMALAQLSANTTPLWKDIQTQIDNLRSSMAQIDASGQTIALSQQQAAYQLAIGSGNDFVSVGPAGQEVPIPVDTVLRRQSSATLQRYQAALTNAKALAYMARLAIEQRIGVPLDSLTQQVGPVDAPKSWADNICSLQGVNYASLSTAVQAGEDGGGIGGSVDQRAISAFADAWVGDYVAELQNFVTYYNVQYPSHQGEDTGVLSLRYDLLGPSAQCTTQAPNLLTNSGDLSQASSWQVAPCSASLSKCLSLVGGYSLPPPQSLPWVDQGMEEDAGVAGPLAASGVTWLLDVSESSPDAGSDAGAGDAGEGGTGAGTPPPGSSLPMNSVVQQVTLPAGSYVLSWWDQARDANGNIVWAAGTPDAGTPPHYFAQILDSNGHQANGYDAPPYTPPHLGDGGGPLLWSVRHELPFTVENAGPYSIVFAASKLTAKPGSVAIADVQLEQAPNGQASAYVATESSTMVSGTDCPMTDADLRSAFTHSCDSTGACHYDLTVPFIIDTSALDGSPLSAKLASGNYNYRQITTALNLVGTGVHDCTNDPTPNCYGSGYVQYDLHHDAQNAGIVGYDGNSRAFDFGVASISGGKALAAEQYITVPMSSNDQSLISQPGIQHVEFGGRPLDGTYYLRIWDSPDLNWSALQDIQLIVDYEYWSQIQVTQDERHPKRLHRAPVKPFLKKRRGR